MTYDKDLANEPFQYVEEIDGDDERLCYCGCKGCRYCNAYLSSEDDYTGKDYVCTACNGGGCTKCEDDGQDDTPNPNESKTTCRNCNTVNVYYPLETYGTYLICDGCDKNISFTGQVLAHPYGQGEDFAGEVYEEEE